jgi:hypothetical protein
VILPEPEGYAAEKREQKELLTQLQLSVKQDEGKKDEGHQLINMVCASSKEDYYI